MKKVLSAVFALFIMFGAIPVFAANAAENTDASYKASDVVYSDHFEYNSNSGYDYDLTNCVIAWVKQAKGAVVWAFADDTRNDDAIIAQAKNADPSLANATKQYVVLKGEGTKNTPNTNGSQAVVTVYKNATGKMILSINGTYSHFVKGTLNSTDKPEETEKPVVPSATEIPQETAGEGVKIRIDTPKKMAVKFADGTVYYGGEMKDIEVGREYMFQMASVNWENGLYDESGNGICGTVVYKMKVVHAADFRKLRVEALKDTERYTVKGIDIIDNDAKTIIINCDTKNLHLETDVNNFFVAYRFNFKNGDYNKQTGIENVINNPVESLSVNLPIGTTVKCDAYKANQKIDSGSIFVTGNDGSGKYENEHLSSVNDYYWNY